MIRLPSSEISAVYDIHESNTLIQIEFKKPVNAAVIRFLNHPVVWAPPAYPEQFTISTSEDGIVFDEIGMVRAAGMIRMPAIEKILALRIKIYNFSDIKWIQSCELSILAKNINPIKSIFLPKTFVRLKKSMLLGKDHSGGTETLKIGENLPFRAWGKGRKYLNHEWWGGEPWGTWSKAEAALCGFRLDRVPKKDLVLLIDGHAFLDRKHPSQEIDVYLKEQYVGTLKYTLSDNNSSRSVKIPKNLFSDDTQVSIRFKSKNSVSPAELGISGDVRELGLGLTSIQVKTAD